MPTKVSVSIPSAAKYVQTENPYLYCSDCGRKDYRVIRAGVICQAFNSATSKWPGIACKGTMTLGTNTIATLSNNVSHDERATS